MSPATAAQRARARKTPSTMLPPKPPKRVTRRAGLTLLTAAGSLLIGPHVVGDPVTTHTLGETSMLTMQVRDTDGRIREALTNVDQVGVDGARIVVDGITYVFQERTGSRPMELAFEDEGSWRLKLFASFLAFPRARFTRAQSFRQLVLEASSPPMTPLHAWIPELTDRQPVAIAKDGGPTTKRGTGRDTTYKFKGQPATERQRKVFDETMTEVARLKGSRRVMIATSMMKTQESRMGEDSKRTGNDDEGDSQQGRNWISLANVRDASKTTRAFLLGPDADVGGNDPSVKGWKQRFGSLRNAPGNLGDAITTVQISSGGYKQWEPESTRNVDAWLGDEGTGADAAGYEFTRGDRDGGRENGWTASGRWAEEVRWQRGSMLNTPYFVSEDELRAGAPAAWIDGDEEWLLGDGIEPGPAGPGRAVKEATMRVAADEWGILPGACLRLSSKLFDLQGTWLVNRVEQPMEGAFTNVTITRPIKPAAEPAVDRSSSDDVATSTSSSVADRLYAACQQISDQGRPYDYGGGHGPALSSLRSTRSGLDCSSSTSLALWMAGAFDGSVAIVSGAFASSWGEAGKGKHFSIAANATHVFIVFHGGGRDGHRFDTVGPGPSGPRLRTTPVSSARLSQFTLRRWPGA